MKHSLYSTSDQDNQTSFLKPFDLKEAWKPRKNLQFLKINNKISSGIPFQKNQLKTNFGENVSLIKDLNLSMDSIILDNKKSFRFKF